MGVACGDSCACCRGPFVGELLVRFKKAKGKKKAQVTLTEHDLIEAGYLYLESKGFKTGGMCFLRIPTRPSEPEYDKRGRKKPRKRVELTVELANEERIT